MWLVSSQKGSAITDFVLVAFPMMLIFSATISLTLGSYARVVLLDATIEGARFAALADQTLQAGALRTRQLVSKSLGEAAKVEVVASTSRIKDVESVQLVSTLSLALLPGAKLISVSSVATRETRY